MKITRRTEQEINISELKAAIKEGRGLEVIRPHDEITPALDTGETITPVCGYVGKHSARFVFKDCLREMWQMNKTMTNKGGYFRSEARRHVLEDILPHLPAKLREAITPRHLCEEIDGETYEYFDSLWLPSATDVFGNDPDGWWKEETDSSRKRHISVLAPFPVCRRFRVFRGCECWRRGQRQLRGLLGWLCPRL